MRRATPDYEIYENAADDIQKRARQRALAKGKKGSTGLKFHESLASGYLHYKAGKMRDKAMYGKKETK